MQKERFKIFVRNHPNLAQHVHNKKMTWQQFYELYDLYGEDDNIWKDFLNNDNQDRSSNINTNSQNNSSNNNANLVGTLKDFMGLFKGIDLNTVQRTLTSIDKAIETFKGIGFNNQGSDSNRNTYEERPKYKYFED